MDPQEIIDRSRMVSFQNGKENDPAEINHINRDIAYKQQIENGQDFQYNL